MLMKKSIRMLLSGTALCLPLYGAAYAQQSNQDGACANLRQMISESDGRVVDQFGDAEKVAKADANADCAALVVLIQNSGQNPGQNPQNQGQKTAQDPNSQDQTQQSAQDSNAQPRDPSQQSAQDSQDVDTQTKNFRASDTVSDTVKITKEAVVEGDVAVRMPEADVDVEQPGAQVKVQPGTASINVDQQAPKIEVRQAKATIQVDLPQPVITIDQPAPEIIVTLPQPGVSLDRARPTVQVSTPDPQVTVSQGNPKVDVDVDAKLVDPNSAEANQGGSNQVTTRVEPQDGGNGDGAQANVNVSKNDPKVQLVQPEQDAQVSVDQAGQPSIDYQSADPSVKVNYTGDPKVRIRQVGKPKVTFNQAQPDQNGSRSASAAQGDQQQAQDQQARNQQGQPRQLSDEDTARLLGVPSDGAAKVSGTREVPVANLMNRDVVTSSGEDLGEVSRVVSNNGQPYVVVEYGGFLGFGQDEVALPAQRVALRGDKVLLLGLTEEDIDAMPDYDAGREQSVARDASLKLGIVQQ